MENKQNKIRKNITIAPDIWEFIETQADSFGVSPSSCLAMIVGQYRQQMQALSEMSKFQGYLDQLKEMQEKNINLPSEIKASDQNVAVIANS